MYQPVPNLARVPNQMKRYTRDSMADFLALQPSPSALRNDANMPILGKSDSVIALMASVLNDQKIVVG